MTTMTNDQIIEAIGNKTVVELADLIEAFKTKFNEAALAHCDEQLHRYAHQAEGECARPERPARGLVRQLLRFRHSSSACRPKRC